MIRSKLIISFRPEANLPTPPADLSTMLRTCFFNILLVLFSRLFQEFSDQASPAGLMAGAKTGAIIAMKVFVELYEIAPMGVVLERGQISIHGTPSGVVAKKDVIEAPGNFRSDLPECLVRS